MRISVFHRAGVLSSAQRPSVAGRACPKSSWDGVLPDLRTRTDKLAEDLRRYPCGMTHIKSYRACGVGAVVVVFLRSVPDNGWPVRVRVMRREGFLHQSGSSCHTPVNIDSLNVQAHLRIVGCNPRGECAPPAAEAARYRVPDTCFSFRQVRQPLC